MQKTRQSSARPDERTPHGAGWLPHGFHLASHSHGDGQLVYAAAGAFTTTTEYGTWIAPADRITWTPPGFEHSHRFYGRTDARILAVPAEECGALVEHPCVFAVSPLLREGVLALTGDRTKSADADRRLRAVVLDELGEIPEQSFHLPEPRDDRLRAATDLLHADPGRNTTLAGLGRAVGTSERTLSRLFHTDLGMSFHRWRTILRIHHALIRLTDGDSVTDTAITCGWSNPSTFIEAFTAVVGQTPGRYQAGLRDREE
ncbi:helix-turn-helix domain-containing protein [Amycolatopsis vancoresmycina]|uniref:helix-turn-helix domain-containing protein n=1 Tax=Amycolatopsis vancoresmycina TaxID=208444 RepID=UPI000525FEF5|nr:AraC family transcriptional regulator [Amycolatopsis vancoresmycina]